MRVAVMQPYIFPYFPYFQLVGAVDCFVFLDTVQFLRRGWMHRNRIKLGGAAHLFTLPVAASQRDAAISEVVFADNIETECNKLAQKLAHAYRKAPCWENLEEVILPLIKSLTPGEKFADFACESVERVGAYAGAAPRFLRATNLHARENEHYQRYILDICKELGAKTYVNAIGGVELYDAAAFAEEGMNLRFLKSTAEAYPQTSGPFVKDLSVIDMIVHLDAAEVQQRLGRFDLVEG